MEEKKSCCEQPKKEIKGYSGILYGLIPHIGCISFIIGSILGLTALIQIFKPLLINKYFFYILVFVSLLFATLSSILYLRRQNLLSMQGIKKKWKYLSVMYGLTVGINLLFFLVIFPLTANVSIASTPTGAIVGIDSVSEKLNLITLKVDIPCSGHAPLISNELRIVDGIRDIKFRFPNLFDVSYDSSKTSKDKILSLEIFKEFKASIIEESINQGLQSNVQNSPSTSLGGGCCRANS